LFFLSRRTHRHLFKKHVAIVKAIKKATIIIVFAAAASLSAQDIAPEESTSGEGENPSETTPTAPPITPTNPDDGSVRLGVGGIAPTFYLGQRFRLSTSLTGGYDDNVNTTPTGSPSWFASPSAVFTYQFGNPRLAMDLIVGAGITYYFAHPGGRDFDPNVYLRLALVYKASERLTFDVRAFAAYQAQPDVTSALSANRRLGNFFRSADNISAHYRWTPRFSTVTSYTFSALEYQNSSASSGDRLENQLSEHARYLLFPTTTATAGYRIGITDYQTTGNNHISQTLTAGLDQTFGPHLVGTFQGGLQLRSEQTSPYIEAGLHYSFESGRTRGTYVIWSNRYSIEESGTGAGSGRETFRTNLLLNYGVTARFSANLIVSYQHGTGAQGADIGFNGGVAGGAENVFHIGPGVRYAITPSLAVNAGYLHTEVDRGSRSAIASQLLSYTRNRYFAGLTFTF
jgi:opacity protein-like surface antigen